LFKVAANLLNIASPVVSLASNGISSNNLVKTCPDLGEIYRASRHKNLVLYQSTHQGEWKNAPEIMYCSNF
jgi:hypothetical protein